MQSDELKRRISAGRGDALADLVLKNARIINVFTDEIDTADIAISGNSIVGVGTYHGRKEVDLHGKYVCPGLIDGHIHIESSMLCGPAFEQAVLPHGTTAVVTDPHEISNVAGLEGLDFMLETTKNLTLSVYFMLPSCVPATDLDESGAVLNAEQLRPYYGDPRVLGLAELMNAYGTVRCDPKILQKIRDCTLSDDVIKKVTKTIYEHADDFKYATSLDISFDINTAADGVDIPFHSGAAAYYTERGINVLTE